MAKLNAKLIQLVEYAKSNNIFLLASMQRSGRHWLRALLHGVTRRYCPHDLTNKGVNDALCFMQHGTLWPELIDNSATEYILLIRDPRDVCLSWAEFYFGEPITTYKIEKVLTLNFIQQWRSYIDTYLPLDAFVVQYEHLCLFPEQCLSKLIHFLDARILHPIMDVVIRLDGRQTDIRTKKISVYSRYKDAIDRYNHHCLHWKRNTCFKHNNIIYDELSQYLCKYGYLQDRHDIFRWKAQYE